MVTRLALIGSESDLAERLAYERRRRGWSLATLAEKMALDPPISTTAIRRIESGSRPVRVLELLAYGRAFDGVDPLSLLTPVSIVTEAQAQELVEEFTAGVEDLKKAADRLWRASTRTFRVCRSDRQVGDAALGYVQARIDSWGREIDSRLGDDSEERFDALVWNVAHDLWLGGLAESADLGSAIGEPIYPEDEPKGVSRGQR